MKTTLQLADGLHARAKALAARLRIPLTRLVEIALEEKLDRPDASTRARKPFRPPSFSLAMKPAYRGVNLNHLAAELETEERLRDPRATTAVRSRQ